MLNEILESFGLSEKKCLIEKVETGLINKTWKVTTANKAYILQKINHQVFKQPADISDNMLKLNKYLTKHYPDYLFVSPLATTSGEYLVQNKAGDYYRLLPFIKDSHTINTVSTRQEAYEAARKFGQFSSLLSQFNIQELNYTLPDFHNLILRYNQFEQAYQQATPERLTEAKPAISSAFQHQYLVETYASILKDNTIPLRVIHHDTKISNVLFDKNDKGLCVIDLDTVMPGYFISDVGDMMRTYLSPANEEEQDLTKITIREDYFEAVVAGYFSEMAKELTDSEIKLCLYAGSYMIYMQAIRFLTDYLNGDIYYPITYAKHNLIRAKNQFTLLHKYLETEKQFDTIIDSFLRKQITDYR